MDNPRWRKWWINLTLSERLCTLYKCDVTEEFKKAHDPSEIVEVIEAGAVSELERERDELRAEVERLKAVVDGKIEAIPEGIILVKRANYKIDDPVFSEAERRFKYKYFFIHAPLDWDGQWEKVEPDLLISALENRTRG